jgi:high affinity Mn2+ porin
MSLLRRLAGLAPARGKIGRVFVSGLIVSASPAMATDEPPVVDWAGLYVGASFGAGLPPTGAEYWRSVSGRASPAFDLNPPSQPRPGVAVGAQAGFNWQDGRLVWGFETDLGLLNGPRTPIGTYVAPPAYGFPPFYSINAGPGGDFYASIRARAGLAFDRSLFYLTGGVASGGARGPATLSIGGSDYTAGWSHSSRMKYAVGAGFEYAFAADWSARVEYLFLSQSLNTQIFDNGEGFAYASRVRAENNLLRFGLNYHFGEANRIPGGIHYGDIDGRPVTNNLDAGGDKEEMYSVHGQTTNVAQAYPKFRAYYDGPNSLPSKGKANVGSTSNIFMGLRLWEGGAVYLNPEVDLGYGLANSVGAASYVDGAVAKVGSSAPYMRFQRYFLRQIIGLDGSSTEFAADEGSRSEVLESTQNQISGRVDRDRIMITLGKFAVGDVFDDNVYAHDPTTGFLNFAFNTMGAFDYAADAWGFTHGVSVEWKQNWWTLRGGVFQLSTVPNGLDIEPVLFRQSMGVTEFETRYELLGQPGTIKFLGFANNGYFSNLDETVRQAFATGEFPPTVDAARRRAVKAGGGINFKQQIMPHIGFFLRASMSDGRYETVDYTDIDRSVSFGLVGGGALWGRAHDEIGVAAAFSGLSGSQQNYFALGGLSVYVGDGALTYGGEKNFESYYKIGFGRNLDATLDYQLLVNPAHNSARGPVNVFGLRLRAAF